MTSPSSLSIEFQSLANLVAELEHRIDELEMNQRSLTPTSMDFGTPVKYPYPEILPGYQAEEKKAETKKKTKK